MATRSLISICALTLLLTACGGGGGDAAPPPAGDAVPDSASASSAGMAGWLKQLTATASDDKEALEVARFAPPQPDDAEPETLR